MIESEGDAKLDDGGRSFVDGIIRELKASAELSALLKSFFGTDIATQTDTAQKK